MMLKLLKTLFLTLVLFSSNHIWASVVHTDLLEQDYITYGGLDWAWASSVNVQYYYDANGDVNELLAPEIYPNWRFATADEMLFFKNNITLNDFKRVDGSFIVATHYWNSLFFDFNTTDFTYGDVASEWVMGSEVNFSTGSFPLNYWFDTFYVRNSVTQPPTQPVPEPATLFIIALALLLLTINAKIRH